MESVKLGLLKDLIKLGKFPAGTPLFFYGHTALHPLTRYDNNCQILEHGPRYEPPLIPWIDVDVKNYDETNEYVRLRSGLTKIGYEVHSLNIFQKQNIKPNICIFLDIPKRNINKIINTKVTKSIVLLREADMISSIKKVLKWKNDLTRYEKSKPITEKARTIYKVLDKNSICSLVEMKPITGRRHQLRKQLYLIGNPIYGDQKYKFSNNDKAINKNLMLHSYQIRFMIKDKKYTYTALLPDYFRKLLIRKRLKLPNI